MLKESGVGLAHWQPGIWRPPPPLNKVFSPVNHKSWWWQGPGQLCLAPTWTTVSNTQGLLCLPQLLGLCDDLNAHNPMPPAPELLSAVTHGNYWNIPLDVGEA